ncbi:extracellular solute-binding protein [Halomarina ordinaria]|uniref:Extracellular solute-binding protein n=1 Tax=Halomarina ordinaria TaxID=3033939 RepID=A0ABD5UBN5_9EURY|nr:extracellular solute-binding protein [Halomarina sp. PSRA2]
MPRDSSRESGGRRATRRRFIAAAGAAGVSAGFAGCLYGTTGSGGETVVSFGFDPSAAQAVGDEIRALFHEEGGLSNDIRITFEPGVQDSGSRRDKYMRQLTGGEADPDLILMDSGWTRTFIDRELVTNLSSFLPQDVLDTVESEYLESSLSTAMGSDGSLYGVPLFPDFGVMQYRKDLVRNAGFQPDEDDWATEPMTWERFSQIMAETLQANADEEESLRYGYVFPFDSYEGLSCCSFNEMMTSWGGAYFGGRDNLFGPIGERPITVDTEPVVNSIRMARSFIYGEDDDAALDGYPRISPENVLSWSEPNVHNAMVNGETVAQRNWPYSIATNATEENYGTDYGVMPLPYATEPSNAQAEGTGGTTSALGGWNMTVNPNTEVPDAVREVIEAATTDEVMLGLFRIWGWLPPKLELLRTQAARDIEPTGRYAETLYVAGQNSMPRPVTVLWPQESSAISSAVNGSASREQAPAGAMTDLKNELQVIEGST